ncbi:hypothetical protein V6N13_132534 [Hibiscus sabdariffa]
MKLHVSTRQDELVQILRGKILLVQVALRIRSQPFVSSEREGERKESFFFLHSNRGLPTDVPESRVWNI